jgi:hypothetical protein
MFTWSRRCLWRGVRSMSAQRSQVVNWLKRNKRNTYIKHEQQAGAKALLDPQWIWKSLVGSMATWGTSKGHDRLVQEGDRVWKEFGFETLSKLNKVSARESLRRLKELMTRLNPRYATKKADYLNKNLALIREMGGPRAVRELAMQCKNAEEKIDFLMQLHGIGPKYSRNIWMYVVECVEPCRVRRSPA